MSVDFKEFFGPGNDITPTRVEPNLQLILENFMAGIQQRQIGFLPRSSNGRLWWYGFAPTPRQQRETLAILDSWIGPTFSDLPRQRGALNPADPFDAALAQAPVKPLRFEVLPRQTAGSEAWKHARGQVRDALLVLSKLLNSRPPSEFDAPRTTVEVLDDLGHAIAARDRTVALACLRELEATADLDQSNLAFLRLRLFAGLEDWKAVLGDRDLDHVLAMRRPLSVTQVIQQAVYARWFAPHDAAGTEKELLGAVAALPAAFRPLFSGTPTTSRARAVVEFLIAVQGDAGDDTLNRLLDEAGTIEPGLPAHLRNVLHLHREQTPQPTAPSEPPAPLDQPGAPSESPLERATGMIARGELQAAIDLVLTLEPSLRAAYLLLTCARDLQSPQQAALALEYISTHHLHGLIDGASARLRDDLAWLEQFTQDGPDLDWHTWLEALDVGYGSAAVAADPEITDAWTPLSSSALTTWLYDASDEVLGKLGEIGGQFMAAHRDIFVEDGAAELSERVLAGLALSGKSSAGVRVQTQALLDYLLSANPTSAVFASALEWTDLIVSANVSAVTTTWAIDILQTATATAAAAAATSPATVDFFYKITNTVRPFKTALDPTDIEAIKLVAGELGVGVPEDLLADQVQDADPGAPYRYLQDSKVVLYSLTESATTRAAQILRILVPKIDIETSAERDGSSKLAAQAANADVFVVVTASAKHAATDFITAKRGTRPVVLVNSRGSSAILRELAEG
ncbi:protein DpdD [Streptomyces hirsutus]|uniref:Protein DpdD n=1 Tax=Streptomyces hirsutus TaxID=35620 RepID=A0ABZ1GS55_9ACTN|nr:protein DpdD [Streptomyces hirsutus]WSD08955.1 protein DpdD [Streptomyces hirsutus]